MFTYLKLKNFLSFKNIEFDLTGRSHDPKHLAMVFGENGAGKSNLLYAFRMLIDLLGTMDVRDAYERLLNQKAIFTDERMDQRLKQQMIAGLRDIRTIIDSCKMIDCDEPIHAEYGFMINGNHGVYTIELGDDEIVYEKLEYLLNKRRGTYFECLHGNITINHVIFLDKDFYSDFRASCKRYWGKHSLLSVLMYELRDKSTSYGWNNLAANVRSVLTLFFSLSYHSNLSNEYVDAFHDEHALYPLRDATEGIIDTENSSSLEHMTKIITSFFHSINSNILQAYYETEASGKKIKYQLYFRKNIAGTIRDIPFKRESTGNHQLMKVLCAALTACMGQIVIIDEADAGIHDLLFQKLIEELTDSLCGQLIITSHNTMLLETKAARDTVYIISENNNSTEIKCISEYENRTYLNNNIRNKYLNNDYKGIPTVSHIDFDALLQEALNLGN